MRAFLVALVLGPSLFGMSQATTGPFVRCFPEWTNADQVYITCNGSDDKIAQYCDPHRSCRNLSKHGFSLEKKKMDNLCLTIRNCSYDSLSCQAKGFISDTTETKDFTVDVCNHHVNNATFTVAIVVGVSVLIGLMIFFWSLDYWVESFRNAIRDFCRNLQRNRNPNQDNQEQDIKMGEKSQKSGHIV